MIQYASVTSAQLAGWCCMTGDPRMSKHREQGHRWRTKVGVLLLTFYDLSLTYLYRLAEERFL